VREVYLHDPTASERGGRDGRRGGEKNDALCDPYPGRKRVREKAREKEKNDVHKEGQGRKGGIKSE
jgi:hypothetical protein